MAEKREIRGLGDIGEGTSIARPAHQQLYGTNMKSTEETFKEMEGVAKKGIDIFKNLMARAKGRDLRKLERQVNKLKGLQEHAEKKTALIKERESLEKKLRQIKVLI